MRSKALMKELALERGKYHLFIGSGEQNVWKWKKEGRGSDCRLWIFYSFHR